MSWGDEIKAECTTCGAMVAMNDVCLEAECRACHGSERVFDACRAAIKSQTVDEILAEAPPGALDDVAEILGKLKKKPSRVLASLDAARKKKRGRARPEPRDDDQEYVRVDSGHPAVTPERVADADTRMAEAMTLLVPGLLKGIVTTTRQRGELCMAVSAQMPARASRA